MLIRVRSPWLLRHVFAFPGVPRDGRGVLAAAGLWWKWFLFP